MRTTIDLPEDLHTLTRSLARSEGKTLSELISDILRGVLLPSREPRVFRDELTGLLVADIGRPVTDEDVIAMEEEEIDELLKDVRSP